MRAACSPPPFRVGSSASLRSEAMLLSEGWSSFSRRFEELGPRRHEYRGSVEDLLCHHYAMLSRALGPLKSPEPFVLNHTRRTCPNLHPALHRLVRLFQAQQKNLVSYWFHGSIGSDEAKPGWSDVDGLAIVSSSTLADPARVRSLRIATLRARSHLLDVMPYQLHGHFIVAASGSI